MPCLHRFANELLPKHPTDFLFIGTFNPEWKIKNGEDPDYFYSRSKNQFWCILPHALNQNCLVDKNRKEKEAFCKEYRIGLTDIVHRIENINEGDPETEFLQKGFGDANFDLKKNEEYLLDLSFYTVNIKSFITENQKTLKGVFLTRKSKGKIKRIWDEWVSIKSHCISLHVPATELTTPSPIYGGIREKITEWKKELTKNLNHSVN